jgi:predicted phage-related endonuclease
MSLTPEQLAIRATGVGGSEVPAILGESPFATEFDVWLGKVHGWTKPETEDMLRGQFFEAPTAAWYAYRLGRTLYPGETVRHATSPVALCTPDFLTRPDPDPSCPVEPEPPARLLSIKSPRRGGAAWGPDGSDEVAPGYLLQLQWEHMILTSRGVKLDPVLDLAAVVDGELRIYSTRADPDLGASMLTHVEGWWARHVVGGEPPSMERSAEAGRWLASRYRETAPLRDATPGEDLAMCVLKEASELLTEATARVDDLKNELKASMGEAGGLRSPAGVVTWRADVKGKRIFRMNWTA